MLLKYFIWNVTKNTNDLKAIWILHYLLTNRKQTILKNSIRCCTIECTAESKMREISVCARVNDTKQIVKLIIITNKHAKASFSSQIYVAKKGHMFTLWHMAQVQIGRFNQFVTSVSIYLQFHSTMVSQKIHWNFSTSGASGY